MKFKLILLITALLILTGCSKKYDEEIQLSYRNVYVLTHEDKKTNTYTYTSQTNEEEKILVTNHKNKITLQYKGDTYVFEGTSKAYTITYPGGICKRTAYYSNCSFHINDDLELLILNEFYDNPIYLVYFVASILLFVLGIFVIIKPEQFARMKARMKYKNAEPTDGYIFLMRISGILVCIVSLGLIWLSLSLYHLI
jgi:hypothetical protein